MVVNHSIFPNRTKGLLHLLLLLLSVVAGIVVTFLSLKKALIFLSLIVGVLLIFLCVTNYRLGYTISLSAGFSIFIVSRYFMDTFPIGWIVELLVYSSFLGLLVHCLIKGESLFKPLYHPITTFFVCYILFILWQVFNPEMYSLVGWFHFFRRQIVIFLIYILTVHFIQNERDIQYLIKIWLFFSVLSAVYAILTQLFRLPYFEDRWVLASKNRENLYYLVDGFKRKYSLYSDPAAFGMDMAASSLFIGVLLFFEKGKFSKIWQLVLLILCLLGAVYSGTRTAYLMILSGLVLFFLLRGINRTTLFLGIGLLFIFIGILFAPVYDNLFINRVRSAFYFSQDASLQVRNINRSRIQPYIHDNPIGGGVYTTGGQGMEYNPEHVLAGFPPDSGYLRTALETGWIGLIVLLLFHFVILRSGIYTFFSTRDQSNKGVLLASTVSLFAFVVANYSQEAFGQIPSCFFFCICIAIITKSKFLINNHPS